MALFTDEERRIAIALDFLGHTNPFTPERMQYEREILGDAFVATDQAWHKHAGDSDSRPNIPQLTRVSRKLAEDLRERIAKGEKASDAEYQLYESVTLYYLYNKYEISFYRFFQVEGLESAQGGGLWRYIRPVDTSPVFDFYAEFEEDIQRFFGLSEYSFWSMEEMPRIFAGFFQLRRAFQYVYEYIIGGSMATVKLRCAVWQSIFSSDIRRYRRSLYAHMGDITTLIMGPSGTGKELVARCIGMSRYIPFDPKSKKFEGDISGCFYPVNLSAVTPTLIESELFGHVKGSFTGAVKDRVGYFEQCPPHGTVFLDELGELALDVQVKLLRVLQSRRFLRVGDVAERTFPGKIIAATNRDLHEAMLERRFREDLYYRLCSDIIVTPSLQAQIEGSPEQLRNLLLHITRKVVNEAESETLAAEVETWISGHLGMGYEWPGNVRELEQCVRNYLIRQEYTPPGRPRTGTHQDTNPEFLKQMLNAELNADDLLRCYCTWVYARCGSYQETARILGIDRRTVRSRVDEDLLKAFGGRENTDT